MEQNKNLVVIIIAVVIITIVGMAWWQSSKQPSEETYVIPSQEVIEKQESPEGQVAREEAALKVLEEGDDTTSAISDDLEEIDMGDIEKEFEDIDKDLGEL